MITSFAFELIDGVRKKVQYIKYSNGRRVKRVFDNNNPVPVDIITLDEHDNPMQELGYHDRFGTPPMS